MNFATIQTVVLCATLALLSMSAAGKSVGFAKADEDLSDSDALIAIEKDYGVAADEIADVLTSGRVGLDRKQRLTRWQKQTLLIAIASTEEVPPGLVAQIADDLKSVARVAHRDLDLCREEVQSPITDRPLPSKGQRDCFKGQVHIVILVDGSLDQPGKLVEAFRKNSETESKPMDEFWIANAGDAVAEPTQTFCETWLDLDLGTSAIVAGGTYMRLGGGGADDRKRFGECLGTIPYAVFGSLPIRHKSASTFAPELLQLLYSPDLAVGMERDTVVEQLRKWQSQ